MSATVEHDPRVRYCTEIVGIPFSELRDDLTCPACDEMVQLMMLDPDVEVLAPPTHLMVADDFDTGCTDECDEDCMADHRGEQ